MLIDQVHKARVKINTANTILSDEKVSFNTRIAGTVFIALSGVLLYLDKIFVFFGIDSDVNFGFTTFYNFIWVLTQSVAPILLIIGTYLRPYKSSFLIAIYCYSVQLIWVFSPQYSDDFLLTTYSSLGLALIIVGIILLIKKIISLFNQKKSEDEEFIEDAKEVLEILKSKILTTTNS